MQNKWTTHDKEVRNSSGIKTSTCFACEQDDSGRPDACNVSMPLSHPKNYTDHDDRNDSVALYRTNTASTAQFTCENQLVHFKFRFCLIISKKSCVVLQQVLGYWKVWKTLNYKQVSKEVNFLFEYTVKVWQCEYTSLPQNFLSLFLNFSNELLLAAIQFLILSRQLRTRRALTLCNNVPMRTRRELSPFTLCSASTLLVLNGTSLNSDNALLTLNWRFTLFPLLLLIILKFVNHLIPCDISSDRHLTKHIFQSMWTVWTGKVVTFKCEPGFQWQKREGTQGWEDDRLSRLARCDEWKQNNDNTPWHHPRHLPKTSG